MSEESISYRQFIIRAIETLVESEHEIFSAGVDILMNYELKEINDAFEVGDSYDFTLTHLEEAEDANVRLIAQAVKSISQVVNSLQNLNAIEDEELDVD